ncbi:FomB family phosphonate monophosphate kinase [Dactylosporangium aurantiacum]|uniref:FomB family phosphonate monophosphate kinase n=1 Tax=Dactylosporangium aurantiacum TaxID=35754 RepID=A0A9Q9ISN0_9ACTN|nr:FomB family phosphonate monophosphate kinase [Dactylosporangium aurantiacum]MDG6103690.1 FomB family phosphonate monophosphate kinase [Dactylosporangium aurantiacum]UWZ59092.1 FomB family phosphonate monophosphate kinase [Dactylosporangium aurantiacum]
MRVGVDVLDPVLRSSRTVDLGVLTLRISSNLEEFDGYAYFPRPAVPGAEPDEELVCVDLDRDPVDVAELEALADRTLRAKRFRTGYYLSHVFGAPAYLVTRGRRRFVFGRRLERTVWPYFVKTILTAHAIDHGRLHLKAAGFTAGGAATLLVGANAGGKTVFLEQACRAGARFLSNTHTLVLPGPGAGVAVGVPSAVRVREVAPELLASGRARRHIEAGDYIVDPAELFGGDPVASAPVRNVVIANYRPGAPFAFDRIGAADAEAFCEQFASALTMYGLKDDVLAHGGGDALRFAGIVRDMRRRLHDLVSAARCYRATVDMHDATHRAAVLAELAAPLP